MEEIGIVLRDLEIADAGIVGEQPIAVFPLCDQRRLDRPIRVEIHLERHAGAIGVDRVEVVLHIRKVVDGDRRDRRAAAGGYHAAGIGARRCDVINIARVMFAPGDDADGHVVGERNVDVALGRVALVAMRDGIALYVIGGGEATRIRLVGDDADGAGFGTRAVERALRTRQHFHAVDIVKVHVQRAADGRDRLLVKIDADCRQRARMVAVVTADDAAHADIGKAGAGIAAARAAGGVGHTREVLHVVIEIRDVQFFEFLGSQCLDAQRDSLQILRTLFRGDHDSLDLGAVLRLLRQCRHNPCQHRRGGQRRPKSGRADTRLRTVPFFMLNAPANAYRPDWLD